MPEQGFKHPPVPPSNLTSRSCLREMQMRHRGKVLLSLVCCAFIAALPAGAQCRGGECDPYNPKAHKPGQVGWFAALLSNAGWGEGSPCTSCHETSLTVEAPKQDRPPSRNFPRRMDERSFLSFHAEAVELTRGKGPLTTLGREEVTAEYRDAYEWVKSLESSRP